MRLALLLVAATSVPALAQPTEQPAVSRPADPGATYDVGFRIGGYGFKRDNDWSWDVCRMNGAGVFGSRSLTGPLFLEAGLDAYSTAHAQPEGDLPLERQSGLASVALGARMSFAPWLRGYVQLGGGLEVTRVSVPYSFERTITDTKAMPMGFLGFGGELRAARHTHLGIAFRTLVMGNFDYDPMKLDTGDQWVASPEASTVFAASPTLANQAQFYLRQEL